MLGISPSEDMDMVAQIKVRLNHDFHRSMHPRVSSMLNEHVREFCSLQGEVRKLCTKERIASEIITNERDEYEEKERRRMIARAAQEQEQVCASKSIPLHELTRVRSDPTVSVVFMWSSRGLYCWELRIFAHHFLREKMCTYFSATL